MKYEEYKNSGVEWIGEVPSHWEVRKIKTLSIVKRGASPRPIEDPKYFDENGEYAWVRIADVSNSERYLEVTTQKLSKLGASLSVKREPGDIFISIAGTVGKPIITHIKCCIHDGFVWFPFLKQNSEFLYYIFMSGQPYLGLGKMGTQLNLNTETIGDIKIPIPTLIEQQAIATYLDEKCGEINRAIDVQKKKIDFLNELKQTIITDAVTKGLNPNAPMKDSGVEWIGEIPEHWEVMKLNFACKKITDFVASGSFADIKKNVTYLDEPDYAMLVRTTDLSGKDRATAKVYVSKHSYQFLSNSNLFGGEIILPNIGASIGDVYIISERIYEKATLGPNSIMLISKTDNNFLYYLFRSKRWREALIILGQAAAQGKFNKTEVRGLKVIIPPITEQQTIVTYIEKKVSKIDLQISKANRRIELLEELKQSIITEAVTGKIKVC